MEAFEVRKVRRYLVRLGEGDGLPDALAAALAAARARRALVRGSGTLAACTLAVADGAVLRVDGPVELVHLEARIEASAADLPEVHALVARPGADGPELLGGRLLDAQVEAVELDLEALEDLSEVRVVPARPDRPAAGVGAASPAPSGGWAAAFAASEARGAAEARAAAERAARPRARAKAPPALPPIAVRADPIPERRRADADSVLAEQSPDRGDWIEHRQFGLCRVDGEDAAGGMVIRLPNGRRKSIHLDVLEVLPPRREPQGLVYPVRPRKRP